jgi:hypothetical protein
MRWVLPMSAVMALVSTTLSVACRRAAVSDKPQPSEKNAAEAPSKCKVSIASSALEGCRAPNDPGCETCYVQNPNGTCTILSGHARFGDDLWVYTSASRETDCPAPGPRCARCMRNSEAILCEPERRECDCQLDPGIDPCVAPSSCECYCSGYNLARTECPAPG